MRTAPLGTASTVSLPPLSRAIPTRGVSVAGEHGDRTLLAVPQDAPFVVVELDRAAVGEGGGGAPRVGMPEPPDQPWRQRQLTVEARVYERLHLDPGGAAVDAENRERQHRLAPVGGYGAVHRHGRGERRRRRGPPSRKAAGRPTLSR
jgi:hypothetical protein